MNAGTGHPLIAAASSSGTSNLQAVAQLYSQLAGVLAGFAFAGIIAILTLTFSSRAGGALSIGLPPLLSAFLGLTVSSLNYALISGESSVGHHVRDVQVAAGAGFGSAGLTLLYALYVLLTAVTTRERTILAALSSSRHLLLRVVLVSAPVLAVVVYTGIVDHLEGGDQYVPPLSSRGWPGLIALVVVCLGTLILALWRPRRLVWTFREIQVVSAVAATLSLASLLATNLIVLLVGDDQIVADLVPNIGIWMFAGFTLMLLASAVRLHVVAQELSTGRLGLFRRRHNWMLMTQQLK